MDSNFDLLKKLTFEGVKQKEIAVDDIVLDRINTELSVINEKGFTDTFLNSKKIVDICNELNLLRSYGLRSCPNSMVNYCLDITKINPIKENLIFEAFIPRIKKRTPDSIIFIPLGFHKIVVEMLRSKYPDYGIYNLAHSTKSESYKEVIFHNNTEYRNHPLSIIMTTEKLKSSVFLYDNVEYYLHHTPGDPRINNRFDIVECNFISTIQLLIDEIGDEYHPYKIPFTDKKVFDYLSDGDFSKSFHIPITLSKKYFPGFKPSSINDLSLMRAMFGPFLRELTHKVVKIKNNIEEPLPWSDIRITEILDESYGLIIYNESILRLMKEIAGIGYNEAMEWQVDILRDTTNEQRKKFNIAFANGCRANSDLSETEIFVLTHKITENLAFLFNKAHSMCHAITTYWEAYYKVHFSKQYEKAYKAVIG